MKKFLSIVILLSVSVFAVAEVFEINRPLLCNDIEFVMNELDAKFQEKPIWIGTVTPKVKATLLVNQSTGTWSLLIIDEKSACGVAAGEGYSYRAPTKTGLTL